MLLLSASLKMTRLICHQEDDNRVSARLINEETGGKEKGNDQPPSPPLRNIAGIVACLSGRMIVVYSCTAPTSSARTRHYGEMRDRRDVGLRG